MVPKLKILPDLVTLMVYGYSGGTLPTAPATTESVPRLFEGSITLVSSTSPIKGSETDHIKMLLVER